jgi:GTP-binding protein LepA
VPLFFKNTLIWWGFLKIVRKSGKDVTSGLYGGDVTRKRKVLEKQKEGKKRMKKIGRVEIPDDAFMSFYEISRE